MLGNNNHQMDPEVEEAIRNNPEMGDYYWNNLNNKN
jgi:hypothetical protein